MPISTLSVRTTSRTFSPIASVSTLALRLLATFSAAVGRALGIAFGSDPHYFISWRNLPMPFSRRCKAWTPLMHFSRQHRTHHRI